MKFALVCGAGGFIGNYIVKRLKREGFWVRGVDIKDHEFDLSAADEFGIFDLAIRSPVASLWIDSLTKSISWPPIWAAPGTYIPVDPRGFIPKLPEKLKLALPRTCRSADPERLSRRSINSCRLISCFPSPRPGIGRSLEC
jgi:hypothetical protein